MPNPVVAIGGASIAGGAYGARQMREAGEDAANASADATQATIDESARQFDTVREDTRVARETGNDALMQLGFLLGVRQAPSAEDLAGLQSELTQARAAREAALAGNAPLAAPRNMSEAMERGRNPQQLTDIAPLDANIINIQKRIADAQKLQEIAGRYPGGMGDFVRSQPGYEFGLQEGERALTNTLTASGASQGGRALKAAQRYGIDYAGSKTDEHLSRMFTLAGYGPAGVNTSANAGANAVNTNAAARGAHANTLGNIAFNNAGASSGAVNNAVNTGLSLYTYNDMMNRLRPPAAP